jgi:hypothetical protein
MAKNENVAVIDFSDDDLNTQDTADMVVVVGGKPTDWIWTFAGPGHPQTVEHNNRVARDALHESRQHEQSRLNGKKVKLPDESVEEVRDRNVQWIVARLIGWTPVRINGEDYAFSQDNARKLLLDPRKPFLQQAIDFLTADDSFTKRSAKS